MFTDIREWSLWIDKFTAPDHIIVSRQLGGDIFYLFGQC